VLSKIAACLLLGFDRRRLKTPTKKEMRLSQQRKNGAERMRQAVASTFFPHVNGVPVRVYL
jgi:hypothetical protein